MYQQPSDLEMIELIERMEAHRDSGGSPFDCPSMKAPIEQKRELQRAIKEIFNSQLGKFYEVEKIVPRKNPDGSWSHDVTPLKQ